MRFFGPAGLGLAIVSACSSSAEWTPTCAPGRSIACVGPEACEGYQVCTADGRGYDPCICDGGAGGGAATSATSASTTGSGGGGTGGGQAFDELAPDAIPGLALWLDSSVGTTVDANDPLRLVVWADQSPNGNNAHVDGAGAPTLLASGFKSFDIVYFSIGGSSSSLAVTDDDSLAFGTGGFAVVAVLKEPNVQLATLWDQGGPSGLRITADANINVLTPTAEAHAFLPNPTSQFHIVSVRGPELEVRIDGAPAAGGTSTSDLETVGGNLWIGAGAGANNFSEVQYLQLVAYKGAVTDAQIAGLELYLKNKYGL